MRPVIAAFRRLCLSSPPDPDTCP